MPEKIRSGVRAGAFLGALLLVGGALAACSASDEPDTSGGRGEQLTTQFPGVPISLNPALAGTGGSTVFTLLGYDPLIYMTGEGELEPDLATSWEFTDDTNTQLELTLREGVEFHGGGTLDADAVVESMNYFLEAGGSAVGNVGPIASVEAEDEDTVLITYDRPFPDGPQRLTQYYLIGMIIGPEGLADPDSLLTSMDGTGQYVYNADESVAESSYVYDRFEGYFEPDAQQYERITVQIIGDPNAVLSAATTGQIDFASGSPATAESAAAAGLDVVSAPFFNFGIMVLDREGTITPALADPKVREAIAYAVDRDAIVASIGEEFATPSTQVANPTLPGYIDDFGFDFDMDMAAELMAESGYPDGFTWTILVESILDSRSVIAQSMISRLGDIGIDVELEVAPSVPGLIESAFSQQYSAVLWPITGTKASDFADEQIGPSFTNAFGITDPELADLIAQTATVPEAERAALEERITERSNELAWFIPLVSTQNVYYVSTDVTNVTLSALNPNPMPVGPAAEFAWQPAG